MKTLLAAAVLALATLVPVATAHNGGPNNGAQPPTYLGASGDSGNCGAVPCENQAILLCNAEVEVATSLPAPELPSVCASVDQDRYSSRGLGVENRGCVAPPAAYCGGVSGRYVGSTGPIVDITGSSESSIFDGSLVPNGVQLFAAVTTLCDAEVFNGSPSLEDEANVDGHPTGGSVPNAVFDDGGLAGACHVTTYPTQDYNTFGCPVGDSAMASDSLVGGSVEIGAGCDVLTPDPNGGGGPSAQSVALCIVNLVILQQNPNNLVPCLQPFISCTATNTCANP